MDAKINLMRIEYYCIISGKVEVAEYSFNLKPLDEQIRKISCEMPLEGRAYVRLKERLFRLLGYDALKELEGRICGDAGEDRRVILLVRFDNGKTAYCGNKELRVVIPSGARSVTSIEIVAFKELEDIKRLATKVLDATSEDEKRRAKGELGEAITEKHFMDSILDEISRRSGIPKDELRVKHLGTRVPGKEVPDFVIGIIGTNACIAVVEVKYVGNVENVKNFKDQLDVAVEQVKRRMVDPEWEVPYGVIVVIAWPSEWILADEKYPDKVGGYDNPYIEFFSKEGG